MLRIFNEIFCLKKINKIILSVIINIIFKYLQCMYINHNYLIFPLVLGLFYDSKNNKN